MFFHFYKNTKNMLFHFYKKTLKTCIKTLNYSIHSSKKKHVNTNQIKSTILLQNTRSVQEMESLPMRNASY